MAEALTSERAADFRRRVSPRVYSALQNTAGLVVCVLATMLLYEHPEFPFSGKFGTTERSVLATGLAFLVGAWCSTRFANYPGVRGISHIIPVVAISYGVVAIVLLAGRFEYSRAQLLGSYASANVWLLLGAQARMHYGRRVFAVIPPIPLTALPPTAAYRWIPLEDPGDPGFRLDGIVADLRPGLPEHWQAFVAEATLAGIPVYDRNHIVESLTGRVPLSYLSANELGTLLPGSDYVWLKRPLEFIVTVLCLPVLLPILVGIALAIRIDGPGSIFYRQQRRGHRGQIFTMIKFRSMVPDVDGRGTKYTAAGDARITRVGRVLRRLRLDELPQIFNVLRGDMSWIGPRPEAIELDEAYRRHIPLFLYRGIVRPGVTGWAQIMQGYAHELDAMKHKLEYDLFYIKNYSFWLDLLIAIRTVPTMIRGFGAR